MMKKITLLIFSFLLLSSLNLVAGDYDNPRKWEEGKLTWDDFQGVPGRDGSSRFSYYLGHTTEKISVDGIKVQKQLAYLIMERELSWVTPENKNPQHLRYNQVIFDIAESFRRKLQYRLDRADITFEYTPIFESIFSQCENEIQRFQNESGFGNKLEVIEIWEESYAKRLSGDKNYIIPDYELGDWGVAMHFDLATTMITGDPSEYFSPRLGGGFGFSGSYKDIALNLNMYIVFTNVKKHYPFDGGYFDNDRAISHTLLDASLGYHIINNRHIKVTPFIGYGGIEFSDNVSETNPDRFIDDGIVGGVEAQFKIYRKLDLIPESFWTSRGMDETTIYTRFAMSRLDRFNDLKGYSFNFSIGIGLNWQNINLK
jgi:hypothetical protein